MSLKTAEQLKAGWVIFPSAVGTEDFGGWITKFDPTRPGLIVNAISGQNTTAETGRISIRPFGSEQHGLNIEVHNTDDEETQSGEATTQATFYRRDGVALEFRNTNGYEQFKHPDFNRWQNLFGHAAYSPSNTTKYGTAALNYNADASSYLYFCNASSSDYEMHRWSGATAFYTSATANTLTVTGSVTLANLGFTATGTFVIAGISFAYTGLTNQTFTGVTPNPLTNLPSNIENPHVLTQQPLDVTAAPKGNILFVRDQALFVANIQYNAAGTFAPRPSEIHRSKVGDATNWTVSATAGDSKRQEFPEGGGPILAVAQDEQAIYVFKPNCVVVWTISNSDVFSTALLKAFDGKTPANGLIAAGALWTGANGIYYVNRNKEIMRISRLAGFDTPQADRISDPVKPSAGALEYDTAVGISFKGKSYLACKQTEDSVRNDVILVFDEVKGVWDTPIIGWNVNDWNIVNNELHWCSSDSPIPRSWKAITDKTDDTLGITANWRSGHETFGSPHLQKTADGFYVEGFIANNTYLYVTVLFDDDGFSGQLSATIKGTDTGIVFQSQDFNVFGLNPFGYEMFGSNAAVSDLRRFRVYLKTKANVEFFSCAFDFAVSGAGQNFEVSRYGVHLMETMSESKYYSRSFDGIVELPA